MAVMDLCNVTIDVSVAELLHNRSKGPYAARQQPDH